MFIGFRLGGTELALSTEVLPFNKKVTLKGGFLECGIDGGFLGSIIDHHINDTLSREVVRAFGVVESTEFAEFYLVVVGWFLELTENVYENEKLIRDF